MNEILWLKQELYTGRAWACYYKNMYGLEKEKFESQETISDIQKAIQDIRENELKDANKKIENLERQLEGANDWIEQKRQIEFNLRERVNQLVLEKEQNNVMQKDDFEKKVIGQLKRCLD